MKLLIVESPTKTKTISKYIGDKSYIIKASVGHIRDLPKSNKDAIDIENKFKPHYVISKGKEDIVKDLIKYAKKADEILLAPDPDREGEAIAWHLVEALGLKNDKRVKRVVFNEITKTAVIEALANPRTIDQDLRKAQEARRVLDRLVGYDLSGILWQKVRYGLGAGRVQSPALRIIMEREREIRAFIPVTFWNITAQMKSAGGIAFQTTCTEEPRDIKIVNEIVKKAEKGKWSVKAVKKTEAKRSPKPPFTTSTLQQTASSRLGYSPSKTMQVAQKLYQQGYITYMRTDSTNLSKEALSSIVRVVGDEFGKGLHEARTYKTKSKNAQEAHEAVRPSDLSLKNAGKSPEQKKLYQLIRSRTLASQMVDAKIMRTKALTNIEENDIPDFTINGSQVLTPGWLLADPSARGEDVELPKIDEGTALTLKSIDPEEKQTQPRPRYTEAGLIKELEKRGIGRPSTYASIMSRIIDHGYVEKEGRTLIPTDTGDVVSSFLEEHFGEYISDTFTADLENKLDDIANGEKKYAEVLEKFYTPFSKTVKSKKKLDKITNLGDAPKEFKCPKCKGKMVIKLSKNGKFMSCADFPDCVGARNMEGKELEGPKEIGKDCPTCKNGKLVEREGKYGMFISCSNYPKCKHIEESEEEKKRKATGVKCPECKKDEIVERRGRFGLFYSCGGYPDCKFAIKAKPTGSICNYKRDDKEGKKCGSLMMEGTKTIPNRCSDKFCPNHNPHKLDKK